MSGAGCEAAGEARSGQEPMKLYSGPISMFGAKVEIALAEKGVPFELELVTYSRERGYEPKHPEVLRINPYKRQVPVLVDGDLEIFDSTQIFEYIESLQIGPSLWPSEPKARARARLQEHMSDEVFFAAAIQRMKPRTSDDDHVRARSAKELMLRYYEDIDRYLQGREFLAHCFGYADIAFFMAQMFAERWGVPRPGNLPHLTAWHERMLARPPVSDVAARVRAEFSRIAT
jgi:glutathione S-transferase